MSLAVDAKRQNSFSEVYIGVYLVLGTWYDTNQEFLPQL